MRELLIARPRTILAIVIIGLLSSCAYSVRCWFTEWYEPNGMVAPLVFDKLPLILHVPYENNCSGEHEIALKLSGPWQDVLSENLWRGKKNIDISIVTERPKRLNLHFDAFEGGRYGYRSDYQDGAVIWTYHVPEDLPCGEVEFIVTIREIWPPLLKMYDSFAIVVEKVSDK